MQILTKKIAIIGLGLIGGSLLKKFASVGFSVIGISRSQSTIDYANNLGIAEKISDNLNDIKDADIVIICTPMNKICSILDKIQHIVSKDCIVTDAGSLKGFIFEHVAILDKQIKFIGGHPMAGTEHSGIENSFPELFKEANWALIPSESTDDRDFNTLAEVIKTTGANVINTNSTDHDKAVALISHAPMVLSQALFSIVEKSDVKDLAFILASSGFRDMTRLAMSNTEMAKDMVEYNNSNIVECLKQLNQQTIDMIDDYNDETLKTIVNKRKKLYSDEGKNIYLKKVLD